MSKLRQLSRIKNAHSVEELEALMDELVSVYEFGATVIISALKLSFIKREDPII